MEEEINDRDFAECLKKRGLVRIDIDGELISKELTGAGYDLERAKNSFSEGDHKWCIIQSYYAMFHAVKALVYSKGYREKSHYCLLTALKALFIDPCILEEKYYLAFDETMNLRHEADYGLIYSPEASKETLDNAIDLVSATKKILDIV
jgi:uncharacterized protein (UPF0332 family)